LRDDGHYIDTGENDNLIVQKLTASPRQLGIFGFSFLEQNADKVQGAHINGVEPTSTRSLPASIPSRGRCTSTSRMRTSGASPASANMSSSS
jgi:phosphate transport system substrate-binding protein